MEINFEEYEINMKIIRGNIIRQYCVRQYPTFYTKTHEHVYISGE